MSAVDPLAFGASIEAKALDVLDAAAGRRVCRLCYGTGARYVIADPAPVDGPYLVLEACPSGCGDE